MMIKSLLLALNHDRKISLILGKALSLFQVIQENKIVFLVGLERYACNPKYIIEEIIRRKLPYELTCLINTKTHPNGLYVPGEVRVVDLPPWPWKIRPLFSELCSAKIWIDNVIRPMPPKKPGQFYIQTWHGSLGIKKTEPKFGFNRMVSSITDFCVSNSEFETKMYQSSYWRGVKILKYGHPRNDILCPEADPEVVRRVKRKVYEFFNLEEGDKIVLYAPTFRDRQYNQKIDPMVFSPENLACYQLDFNSAQVALADKLGGRWRFLFRLHHVTQKARAVHSFFDGAALDASDYHDMQELMAASEVLISDYSSCLFDFMLTRRPAFIFATDMAEYENDRGFYYSPRSAPFPIAENNEELSRVILNFDSAGYQEDVTKFLAEKGCVEDGQASHRVVNLLERLMGI